MDTQQGEARDVVQTVEGFQAEVQALGRQLDAFTLDRIGRLTAERRHHLEDARTHLMLAERELTRAGERRRRRRPRPH